MSIIGSTQFLERIQFFNGERLFASDLQSLESFNREMRWLHNQSLHQPGVASGFQVTGNIGDRQVTVSPGYALDCCGREIVLTESQVLEIPPVADDGSGNPAFYDLTVAYPDDSQLTPSESRTGICTPAGVVSLREAPVFCWVELSSDPTNHQPIDQRLKNRINGALFLVLAQVQIFNCQLKQPVSTVPRRNARPSRQPRINCGVELNPGWNLVLAPGVVITTSTDAVSFGEAAYNGSVDTSSAGFQSTPNYSARIVGLRTFPFTPPAVAGQPPPAPQTFFMDALLSILPSGTPKSFQVQIFPNYETWGTGTPQQSDITTAVGHWTIAWMGVES
jgi:hypothetical protein